MAKQLGAGRAKQLGGFDHLGRNWHGYVGLVVEVSALRIVRTIGRVMRAIRIVAIRRSCGLREALTIARGRPRHVGGHHAPPFRP